MGVTYSETQAIYDGGVVNGLTVDKIIAINNLKYAWEFILENEVLKYGYNELCQIHKLAVDKLVLEQNLGKLRTTQVNIGGTNWKPDFPIETVIKEELEKYIDNIKIDKPSFEKNTFDKNLKLSGIITNNNTYPTLAGTLIFADYPQSFYPQLFVACAVIPGINMGDVGKYGERFIDNKRIEGTIEEMLESTMNFLRRNMRKRVIIDSNGKRKDRTEYPLEALREAVANALIHRDYSVQTENAYISVYMYEDRIEILNPGELYGVNKLEKLGTDTVMESRNPTIVRILEGKGSVIENRHSGIPTMKREMKKYNLPEPEFYEEKGNFKVIFRKQGINKCGTQKEEISGTQTRGGTQKYDIERLRKKVLEYCSTPKTSKKIREYLKISSKSYISTYIIKPLIDRGMLDYTNNKSINAKNQKYVISKKNNNSVES